MQTSFERFNANNLQRFSLLQEKVFIRQCVRGLRQLVEEPGFIPKRRELCIFRRSQISTALDPYFLSYLKNYWGSAPPLPAGIGLSKLICVRCCYKANNFSDSVLCTLHNYSVSFSWTI